MGIVKPWQQSPSPVTIEQKQTILKKYLKLINVLDRNWSCEQTGFSSGELTIGLVTDNRSIVRKIIVYF